MKHDPHLRRALAAPFYRRAALHQDRGPDRPDGVGEAGKKGIVALPDYSPLFRRDPRERLQALVVGRATMCAVRPLPFCAGRYRGVKHGYRALRVLLSWSGFVHRAYLPKDIYRLCGDTLKGKRKNALAGRRATPICRYKSLRYSGTLQMLRYLFIGPIKEGA